MGKRRGRFLFSSPLIKSIGMLRKKGFIGEKNFPVILGPVTVACESTGYGNTLILKIKILISPYKMYLMLWKNSMVIRYSFDNKTWTDLYKAPDYRNKT